MNMKFMSLSALALSLSLCQSSVAFAHHEDHERCFDAGGMKMHKMIENLDLTAEQKDKIKSISDKAHEVGKAKRDELHAIHMQVNDVFDSHSMNETKIDGFVSQEQQIIGAMIKLKMMERLDICNVLTDEQRAKMADMMKKWEEKHKEHADD
ncbi:MAG: Spy/CpxP family protein refolding chaperone [Legionellaceae bacterium]|nr:Spy/CpxP family protein refolding chaperone [Legionellaceae bacterium]